MHVAADHRVFLQSLSPDLLTNARIGRNSGVEVVSEAEGKRVFFPRSDWLPVAEAERNLLFASHPRDFPAAVTLFKLDDSILGVFEAEVRPMLTGSAVLAPDERAERIARFAEQALNEVRVQLGVEAERIRSRDVYAIPGPSRSTSYDFASRGYIGLHLDNHQKLPLAKRARAFQLLNLNCGTSHRYFQFINIAAAGLFGLIPPSLRLAEEVVQNEAWRLKDQCLSGVLRDYPVVRVRVEPGEGYLCVTQNIIHDGATSEECERDVSFLIGGWYRRSEAANR